MKTNKLQQQKLYVNWGFGAGNKVCNPQSRVLGIHRDIPQVDIVANVKNKLR
jgi:hypothetical protein